jgi:hypothetical protein
MLAERLEARMGTSFYDEPRDFSKLADVLVLQHLLEDSRDTLATGSMRRHPLASACTSRRCILLRCGYRGLAVLSGAWAPTTTADAAPGREALIIETLGIL